MITTDVFNAYSRYYDLLYRDKDYAAEVGYLRGLLERYGSTGPEMLEFGSGTGQHGRLLAAQGIRRGRGEPMIQTYIDSAMRQARYELIQDDEPYYGEVPELQGVWATGRTLEQCRQNLLEAVDGWLLFRIARGMPIPPLGDTRIVLPREMTVA